MEEIEEINLANDFFDKIMKDEHLKDVLNHFSPIAGKLVQTLMMAYEQTFGDNGSSYLFVYESLEDLISRHENYGFYARSETVEARQQILRLLTSTIYERGVKWLKDNELAEPKHMID